MWRNIFSRFFVSDSESDASDAPPVMPDCGDAAVAPGPDPIMERFVAGEKFIFTGVNIDTGRDLRLVAGLANSNPALKCLIVPRTISAERLDRIKYECRGFVLLYSECDESTDFSKVQVLVADFNGALPGVCRYGSCAFIGGSDVDDITEAAACGLPTAFGTSMRTAGDLCRWVRGLESDKL